MGHGAPRPGRSVPLLIIVRHFRTERGSNVTGPLKSGCGNAEEGPTACGAGARQKAGGTRGDRIKVMVVDDSVVVRKIVPDVLSEAPAIEVVGTAVNGKAAVGKLEQLKP